MLKIYDLNHNALGVLKGDKETKEEFNLKDSTQTLHFKYPRNGDYAENIVNEGYIETEYGEYVIKSVSDGDSYITVDADMSIDELESQVEQFVSKRKSIENAASMLLAGTGWTVAHSDIERKRTVHKNYCSRWDVLKQMKSTYTAEMVVDTVHKTVSFYEKYGADKGTYFIEDLNLRKCTCDKTSYDFYTQIMPVGKNGLTIEEVNGGSKILENFQYSKKKKLLIWKDERYTHADELMEDAIYKLEEISQPYASYTADVIDLARKYPKQYGILSYWLGDTITLVSNRSKQRVKQRIKKLTVYMHESEKNTCEISNTRLDFVDIQKEAEEATSALTSAIGTDGSVTAEAMQEALLEATGTNIDGGNATSADTVEIDTGEADSDELITIDGGNAYN